MRPTMETTTQSLAQRGQQLYDQHIRAQVEEAHRGDFLVLHVDSGDYEIAEDELTAFRRAKAKHPGAQFYFLRIGHTAVYRLGFRRSECSIKFKRGRYE